MSSSEYEEHKSLIECVVGDRLATLVFWRGDSAKRIALLLAGLYPHYDVRPLPCSREMAKESLVPRNIVESANLRETEGMFARTLHSVADEWRLIVCILEHSAYTEIDRLIASSASAGTPILPVTFRDTEAQIGPIIIGGNTKAFYSSRLGRSDDKGLVKVSTGKAQLTSSAYSGKSFEVIAKTILEITKTLPDAQCFSVHCIDDDNGSLSWPIPTKTHVVEGRLQGTLWSVFKVLDPSISNDLELWKKAAAHIQSGRVLAIESAFQSEFAAAMHAALSRSSRWTLHCQQFPYFFFHHHNIYDVEQQSAEMLIAGMIFSSQATIDFVTALAGSDCSGPVHQSASWYMPGDHSTPHSDAVSDRKVAFVWHLARNWDASWGGHLVWMSGDRIFPAAYNQLYIFDTHRSGRHFVMPVAATASEKRLCWNGWWTSSLSDAIAAVDPDAIGPVAILGRVLFH